MLSRALWYWGEPMSTPVQVDNSSRWSGRGSSARHGAHALRELQFLDKGLLVLRGGRYPTWEEMAARLISRDVLR